MKNNIAYHAGIPTLKWELIKEDDTIYLEYEVIAPFKSKGKIQRQTWSWSTNYPIERLYKEAHSEMDSLANKMWGGQ